MDTHPTVDELAAYAADDVDDAVSARVRDHVADCADCLHDLAGLRRVHEQLAAVPALTMPADVAARLDAAITAERERPAGGAAQILPMDRRRRLRGWVSGVAAGSVAAALVGVVAISAVRDDGTDREFGGGDARITADGGGGSVVLQSGNDYSPANTRELVRGLFSRDAAVTRSAETAGNGPVAALNGTQDATTTRLLDPGFQAACLATVTTDLEGELAEPVRIDVARFTGKPALVVVLPAQTGPSHVDVYIVGPRCGTNDDADLLYFERVARA